MANLQQGLVIAATGMGGVFAVLFLLMLCVKGIGVVFGKKPAPHQTAGSKAKKDG